MHEGSPNNFEEGVENIPTPDEVESVFGQLVGQEGYEDIRKLEDEQGLYLWDIIISGEDGDTEYSYKRAGQYKEGQTPATAIHVTFFDEEGIPSGGYSVAKYVGGKWKLTP